MKRLCCGLIVLPVTLAGRLTSPAIWAEPSEATYQNVSLNCEVVKLRLKQVQINDSLTRVNYGQAYESVIEKVLTPANTRLVANRYDASKLVSATTKFDEGLRRFRETYRAYKTKLDELVASDCKNNPIEFYSKLEVVRTARTGLNHQLAELNNQLNDYKISIKEVINGRKN